MDINQTGNYEVGIDLADVKRFTELSQDSPFYTKVFTAEEIAYCKSKVKPDQHFAGTFAAKEAVKKALRIENIPLIAIQIKRNENGSPSCNVEEWSTTHDFKISISHSQEYAVAMCLALKK